MKRYRKQAKLAMAVALATTSLGNTVPMLSAQEEANIQENDAEKKDEGLKIEPSLKVEEPSTVEDEELEDEKVTEIDNITEEISSLENNQIENKEENNSVEKADTEIIMNEDFFPDPGFREVLKDQMNVKEGQVLSNSDINNVFWLFLGGTKENPRTDIKSLEGIQYFYNLGYLDCAYQIELTGTLDLTSNTKIGSIQLIGTKLNGLNIDGLNYINVFNIGDTNIGGTFDLSNCTNLEILNVANTNVSAINIDGLTKLTHFYIYDTNIGGEVDLSANTNLKYICAGNSGITGLNIDGLTNLVVFEIGDNENLEKPFDLSRNTALQSLVISNTKISQLNIDGLTNLINFEANNTMLNGYSLDFSKHANLQVIKANDSGIHGVNIDGLTNLIAFEVGNNKELEGTFDLSKNPALQSIVISNTKTSQLNIDSLTNLVNFEADFTMLNDHSLNFSGNTALKTIKAHSSGIREVNIDGLTNLTIFDVSSNENLEGEFDLSNCANLLLLGVYDTKVSKVDVTDLTKLTHFYIHNTRIDGEFDLSKNAELKYVYANDTKVTGINVNGLTNLVEFEVSNNPQFEGEFDFTGNPQMKTISASNTKVSSINAKGLSNLTYLGFGHTLVRGVIDLRGCDSLRNFYAAYSEIEQINTEGLSNLEMFIVYNVPSLTGTIDLSGNKSLKQVQAHLTSIDQINLEGAESLTNLDLYYTNISQINLEGLDNLVYLAIHNTPLSQINVENLTKLQTLYISNTNISGTLDFRSNTELQTLAAYGINVDQINVEGLTNLRLLSCHSTSIPSLDVSTNTNLSQLNTNNNNLTWLNIADNPNLAILTKNDSMFDLGQIGDSFNIATVKEAFKGIDISKVTVVSGASYDPTTGEVSGYRNGTPIVYRYDCGTMENGEAVTLTVTLNFTKPLMASEIRINHYEGKIYDGIAVSDPTDITKTAESSGNVTFEWFSKTEDGNWEPLEQAPVNAGNYGVKAHLAADLHYAAADSGEPTPFEITKATSNISINSYANKDWDGNPVSDPTDITRTQNGAKVTFKYYRADDMVEIAAPSEVGQYKVKAFLSGDANYTDSESDFVDFSILSLSTTVTLTYGDQVYTGNPVADPQKDVHYTIEGSTGDVTIEWYNANDLTTPLAQAPVNVGSYVVKVSVAGTSTHDGASATASFQITPAESSIIINSYEGKEWDGTPVSNPTDITRTQNGAEVTFKYYRADDMTEITAPSEVGEYKVKAFLSGDANYADSESDFVDFSIRPARTTINLTYEDQVYTGNPVADPQYTIEGSTGDVTIEWYEANDLTTPLTQAPINVGSYVVKVTVAATNTHVEASATASFQITPATSTIRINSYEGKVWDGNPVSDPTDITRTQNTATVTFKYYRADGMTEIPAPSEVGAYKVKAFLSGDANYIDSESDFVDFSIVAASTTINLTYGDQVYTGNPVANPQYTVEGSTGAVTIEWYEANDLTTPLTQAPTNVGSYVVKVVVAGTSTHDGASATASFQITPATSTISINSYEGKVWDGNPVSDPTDITRTQNGAKVTFKYYRADDMTEITAPSEVGSYKVKAFLSGDTNYIDSESNFIDFSIVAASTTINLTYGDQTYTGNPVANPQYTVEGSTGAVTIEWYEANDLTTPLTQAPTNVGSYVVKVSVAGTSTHDGASATAPFQITPAASTISINSYDGKVYDGTAVSNPTDITTAGSDGAVTFEWFVKTEDGNWAPLEQAPVNVGNYGVKAHLAANQNYTAADSGEPTPFEITQATSSISINSYDGKVWDGNPVSDPTDITRTQNTATVTFKYYRADDTTIEIPAPSEVGAYKVKAFLSGDANYKDSESNFVDFNIAALGTTITLTYGDQVYTGNPVADPQYTVEGSTGAVTIEWYEASDLATPLTQAPTNVGSYVVKVSVEGTDTHTGASKMVSFEITPASSTVSINSYEGKVWDGKPVSNPTDITRTQNGAEVTFEYYRADDMVEIAAPSEVGEYKVKAFLSGDTNYIDSESNFVDFSIVAASTTINLTYGDQIYTGNPVANPQYTVEGSTGAVTIEWYEANDLTTPLTQAPTNVGSYVVKVSVAGTSTHDGASATAPFQITPAASTISINSYEGKVYDGTAVSNPTDITTAGSDGAVTFEWFVKTEDGNWAPLEQAPVNVGNYGVKAHLAANQNYTAADSGEPTPFEITQATSSISINSYDGKVYDGNPVSDPTDITRTQNTATVTFKYYRADDTTTEIPAPSEVGAYKVKAFLSGDANYKDSESNFVDFNIAALGTTIALTYGDQVYTGNPVADPQYTVEGSTGAVTIEWYEANDLTTPLTQAPTNVGSYVVKVSVEGTETHTGASKTVSFEITPAASTISINSYEGKVYDGTAVSNPTDITTTGSDGAVTFEWFVKTENGNWAPLEQAPVNAGNYGVKAHLAANQNYTAADSGEPTPFEITQATSAVSINSYDGKVYDGTAVSNPTDITTGGSDGAVTFEWFTKAESGEWVSLGEQAPTNTGSYGVKAHLAANQNYAAADSGEPTPFEITKATSTVSINIYEGKVYDGTAVSNPTDITTAGSDGAVTFEWFTKDENGQWKSLGNEAPVNVGEYGVKAHLAANQNYAAADSGEPVAFTIERSISTIEILDDLNKTYDGEVVEDPSIKVEGTSETATIAWFKKESDGVTRAITWTPLTSAPVNAGDYKVVVTVAENNNSLGSIAEQEFTIAKAETNVSIEGTLDKEYDGVEVEVPNIKVEGSSGATTIEWYQKDVNGAWELLPNAPKEVGEYKIVVKVEEDENYLSVEVEQTFTISEKVEVPSTPEEGGDNTTTEEEKVEGVQTGDVSQTSMWTMLVGLSMSMMYFLRRKKTK